MFKKFSLKTKITVVGLIITAISSIVVPILIHYVPPKEDPPQTTNQENIKGPAMGSVCHINAKYHPSGIMGDICDVSITNDTGVDRFVYEVRGHGPHEWNWKYVNDELNTRAAQFAGVMYLNPPDNWGQMPHGGGDLTKARHTIWGYGIHAAQKKLMLLNYLPKIRLYLDFA